MERVLLTAIDTAQGDLNKVQAYLENWYDSCMDRISGWYKRSTHWALFWIALVVAITVNINTINLTDYLSHNDVARAALVARAQASVRDSTAVTHDYYAAKSELDSLALPIGWANGWGAPRQHRQTLASPLALWNDVLAPVVGWLITALAAMLGAPFWFDVLNKVMVIRSTVKPHEKRPEKAPKDRPAPTPPLPGPLPIPIPAPAFATDLDGCGVEAVDLTTDEDLPAAIGGVAAA
jgi:hypothetical protein